MAEKRVRWGLLSTAWINERLIPVIRESKRSELLAVASRGIEKAERYAREWDIPRAYGYYEDLLADPDIDVVYIPLPNSLHAEWSIKSAEAGKHLLCEKPLALTPEEVDRMAVAARRNGVILQEAAMYRFHPHTLKVQKLIAQGAIGDVRLIRGVFTTTLDKKRFWIRLEPSLGGGSLWDLGSYPVSFIRAVLGEEPVEVGGWQVLADSGVDLSFIGQMRFATGALAQFNCSFETAPHSEAEVIGSQGMIHLDHPWQHDVGKPSHVRILSMDRAVTDTEALRDSTAHLVAETLTDEDHNAYQCEVDAMVASILDGDSPIISPADSRGNIATLVALYKSAREGELAAL